MCAYRYKIISILRIIIILQSHFSIPLFVVIFYSKFRKMSCFHSTYFDKTRTPFDTIRIVTSPQYPVDAGLCSAFAWGLCSAYSFTLPRRLRRPTSPACRGGSINEKISLLQGRFFHNSWLPLMVKGSSAHSSGLCSAPEGIRCRIITPPHTPTAQKSVFRFRRWRLQLLRSLRP